MRTIRIVQDIEGYFYVEQRRWWWPFWIRISNFYIRQEEAKYAALRATKYVVQYIK